MACTENSATKPGSDHGRGFRILVINPGSTSTKIAVYVDEHMLFQETVSHESAELAKIGGVSKQYQMRLDAILGALGKHGESVTDFDAVVGRGGLLKPVESGVYEVNEEMVRDLTGAGSVPHASNLGAPLAREIAARARARAFIADPVVVDELWDVARLSGLPEIPRRSVFHALNHKAVARQAARDLGMRYEDLNLVVAHLGGGITVGAHLKGRVVDVSNGLDGEGPFTPERAGAVPALGVVDLCFSGKYSEDQVMRKLVGAGGLVAYLGTSDASEVERRIGAGDERAEIIFEAMAYQVAKEIGAYAAVLSGDVDAIILTGGLAHSRRMVEWIRDRVSFIAPVMVYPGENEMQALAQACLRVLRGEEEAKVYR
ncbi:MAG: butyrate kinase [Firmicutes bacterium]|jgi:butyrate kinase|nr:butyrate kinase [Bacillota bacterium]MDH7495518.1 butyrate kinase [Bacillota bacterium]